MLTKWLVVGVLGTLAKVGDSVNFRQLVGKGWKGGYLIGGQRAKISCNGCKIWVQVVVSHGGRVGWA